MLFPDFLSYVYASKLFLVRVNQLEMKLLPSESIVYLSGSQTF